MDTAVMLEDPESVVRRRAWMTLSPQHIIAPVLTSNLSSISLDTLFSRPLTCPVGGCVSRGLSAGASTGSWVRVMAPRCCPRFQQERRTCKFTNKNHAGYVW